MTGTPSEESFEQAKACFLEGNACFERGELSLAQDHYEAALRAAPGRPSVLANLGVTLFKQDQFAKAREVLGQAVQSDGVHRDAWVALGLSCHALQDHEAGLHALEQALRMGIDTPIVWSAIARIHTLRDRLNHALEAWDRALAKDDTLAEAWSERGTLLRHAGELDEAARCFHKAIDCGADPELHQYYLQAVTQGLSPSTPPPAYVRQLFDSYADDFEDHLVNALKYQAHSTLLAPLKDSGQRFSNVLDLGCGTGLCAQEIAEFAQSIVGVDVAPSMVQKARATGLYREVIEGDLVEALRARPDVFDLIIAADVLIYVGAPQALLEAAAARLQPDGLLALTIEPSPNGEPFRLLPSLRYGHSLEALVEAAKSVGLRQVRAWQSPIREDQGRPILGHYILLRRTTS